jgi:hypothetical protein
MAIVYKCPDCGSANVVDYRSVGTNPNTGEEVWWGEEVEHKACDDCGGQPPTDWDEEED